MVSEWPLVNVKDSVKNLNFIYLKFVILCKIFNYTTSDIVYD